MAVWWCNQRRCWPDERAASVVCSSAETSSVTYRQTVGKAKSGDVVVHYVSPYVVAFSRARENAKYYENLPLVSGADYGSGWRFRTEYFDLKTPIHKSSFASALVPLIAKHYPINRKGNVQMGYFFPFDEAGLREVLRNLHDPAPDWLLHLASIQAPKDLPLLSTIEARFKEEVAASLRISGKERRTKLSTAPRLPEKVQVIATVFLRNPVVVAEVLSRAQGRCEKCLQPAPFRRTSDGSPYLEVHHRVRLADGGEDTLSNAIALCPNCHRQAHFG